MIVDERMVTYMNSLDKGNTPFLNHLEQEALKNRVPIIRREMQSFLKVLLQIKAPKRILEVGTAVGFSTLLMSTYNPADCEIVTIENYEKRIPIAKENFRKAGKEEQITLLEGDAQEILKTLTGSFDFIFMDAAKGQYINFLPEVLRLLEDGGILLSDNVLQDGDIVESHFAVERRNRTIYKRMREYLYVLKHHELLETSILPLGDGVTPRVRTYREKAKRSGIIDRSEEKEAMRKAEIQRLEKERKLLRSYIKNGRLEFANLPVIEPYVRDMFLLWMSKALEKKNHRAKTEDGQIYYIEQTDTKEYCTLKCTDGEFQMPCYTMVFEEREQEI